MSFYEQLTGWPRVATASGDVDALAGPNGLLLWFQHAPDHQPPVWGDPHRPQQIHLDFMVDDLDAAEPAVLALGARLLEGSPKPIGWRVYADPAGHPFCLTTN